MITFKLNGLEVQAEQGSTILDVARFYGLEIPTSAIWKGWTPGAAVGCASSRSAKAPRPSRVSSCTYRVEEGWSSIPTPSASSRRGG